MELDWFTLIAQGVNFLVLVWLLKHFLYGRIVQAMNDREARIARRLEEAAQKREEADRETDLFQTKNRELDEQRGQLLAQANEEAQTHREQLMAAARAETEAAQTEWLESLQRERQELLKDLGERVGQQVFACARQALKELANTELEGQILSVFVERLETLEPAERDAVVAAVRDSDHEEIEIRTAFPLPPKARESLSQSLRKQLDDGVNVRFATAPELVCGIELRAHSQRLVWNLDSYLDGLEARVFEVLDERTKKDAVSQ